MSAGHAFQRILEVGEGLDVVELRGADEGEDRCPACGAAIGSGEQVVLAAERDGANGTLDGVGVEFNAPVIEEAAKATPTVQCIADRIGKAATGRNVSELRLEPSLHRRDQRKRLCLSRALSSGGRLSPDIGGRGLAFGFGEAYILTISAVTAFFPVVISCVYRKPKPERNGDEVPQGSGVNL